MAQDETNQDQTGSMNYDDYALDFGTPSEDTAESILQPYNLETSDLGYAHGEKPFIGNDGLYAIDADTFGQVGSDTRYRLAGVDAREVEKVLGGEHRFGELGADEQRDYVIRLANRYGYTNVKSTGQKDPFGREIADLTNAHGESFTDKLIREGVVDLHKDYATTDQVIAQDYGKLADAFRDQNIRRGEDTTISAWDLAAADIQRTIAGGGLIPKLNPLNEAEFAEAERLSRELGIDNPYSASRMLFRHKDRDELNNAYSPLATGWDAGLTGFAQAWYGAAQLAGVAIDSEWLKTYGSAGVVDLQHSLDNLPTAINNYKDVNSAGDAWDYVAYLAGSSAPYLLNTILSTAAGSAIGTVTAGPLGTIAGGAIGLGAGLLSPVITYAGQTWNEMEGPIEDRDASIALGAGLIQGTLDRIGVRGIQGVPLLSKFTKDGGNNLGDAIQYIAKRDGISADEAAKKILKSAEEEYASLNGISLDEAKVLFANASKETIASLTQDVANFAASQITKGRVLKQTLVDFTKGGASESLTEVLQETVAYNASVLGSGGHKTFDFDEFYNRIANAAIGGGVLGAPLGSFASVRDSAEWRQLKFEESGGDPSKRTSESIAGERLDQELGLKTNDQIINYAGDAAADYRGGKLRQDGSAVSSFDQKAVAFEETESAKSWLDHVKTLASFNNPDNVGRFLRSAAATAISNSTIKRGPHTAAIASLFGGRKAGIAAGATYEEHGTQKGAVLKNMAPDKDTFLKTLGLLPTASNQKKVAEAYREIVDNVILPEKEGKAVNIDNLSEFSKQHIGNIRRLYDQNAVTYNAVHNVLADNAKMSGEELGFVENYAAKHRSLAKDLVFKNKERFIKDLMDTYGFSQKNATDLTDDIINNVSYDTDFTQIKQFQPKNTKRRTLGMSEAKRPDGTLVFDYALNIDPFTNLDQAINSAVNRNSALTYFGKDGEKVNALLEKALEAGEITKEEANRIAYYTKAIIDSSDGNYKPVKSDTLRYINSLGSTYGIILYGPGFLISSIPELANVAATSNTLGSGYINDAKGVGVGMVKALFKGVKNKSVGLIEMAKGEEKEWPEVSQMPTQTPFYKATLEERFKQSGFASPEVGQAHITGHVDPGYSNSWRSKFAAGIFKGSGLIDFTNTTRILRSSLFDDEVWRLVRKLSTHKEGEPWLNKHQRARDELVSLGMDADTLVRLYKDGTLTPDKIDAIDGDSELGQWLHDQWITGSNRWTDFAIPSPGAANRPLIYQNPNFRLMLLFQGFISTFTSIHLPRMYQRAKNQGVLMTYNAFGQVATLGVLAYMAQAMKDYAIYGDEEDNPLSEGQKAYRALRKTGLLGTPERVVDMFFPLYEDRTSGVEGVAKDSLHELSPLGNVAYSVTKGATQLVSDDPREQQRGINNLLRGVPLTSIYTPGRHELVRRLTGGPFGTAQ